MENLPHLSLNDLFTSDISQTNFKLKNILLIIPNLGKGGAQQVFRDQLQFYSKKYTTIGCVFNWDGAFEDDRDSNIFSLDIPAGKNWLSKIRCFWRRVVAVRKIKKRHNIDFSISHLEGADYVNLFSRQNENVICWIHGSKMFDENIEGALGIVRKKILIPLTYGLSKCIITVSEGIRQELIRNFGISAGRIRTIYNSFDMGEILKKTTENLSPSVLTLFTEKTILITHCRLSRQKNLFSLIDIFKGIQNKSDIKLVVLGDGELREDLLNYCRSKDLGAYSIWNQAMPFSLDYDIYFFGYERNPYPFLSHASLYLMTSSWEGFPLSLCEAMACNVPVLSSDCYTGPREIISPEHNEPQPVQEPIIASCGILMPLAGRNTIKIWANMINAVLNNVALQTELKQQGKNRVHTFDRKNIASQWIDVLEDSSNNHS